MYFANLWKDQKRKEELRLLASYIVNFSGMGTSSMVQPEKLMKLPLIDNELIELPIKTEEEALQILKQLING